MPQAARTDIGFQGGQVLALRLGEEAYRGLLSALSGGTDRWHALESEDERIEIEVSQVVYVRRETGAQKVGF